MKIHFLFVLLFIIAQAMSFQLSVPSFVENTDLKVDRNQGPTPPSAGVQLFAVKLSGMQWSNTSTQVVALNASSGSVQYLKNLSQSESFGFYPPMAATYDGRTKRLYLVDVENDFWRVEMQLAPVAEVVREIHVDLLRGVAMTGLSPTNEMDRLLFVGASSSTTTTTSSSIATSMALFVVDLPFGAAQQSVDLQATADEVVLANAPSAFALADNRYYYASLERVADDRTTRAVLRNVHVADSTFERVAIVQLRFVSMLAWDNEWKTLVAFGDVVVSDPVPRVESAFVRIDPANQYNVTVLSHATVATEQASASFAYTYNSALHAFIYVNRRNNVNFVTTVGLDPTHPYLDTVSIANEQPGEYFAFIALNQ